jgi:hypothetical protein
MAKIFAIFEVRLVVKAEDSQLGGRGFKHSLRRLLFRHHSFGSNHVILFLHIVVNERTDFDEGQIMKSNSTANII